MKGFTLGLIVGGVTVLSLYAVSSLYSQDTPESTREQMLQEFYGFSGERFKHDTNPDKFSPKGIFGGSRQSNSQKSPC